MPRYIGYKPIGTANTSVTRLAAGPSITSLLLTLNGTNGATSTVDEAGSHTITFNGNAQLSTGQKKFGTASLLLDGSGDYLDVSQDSKFNLTGDFTIECWIRTSSTAGDGIIVDLNRLSSINPAGFVFYRDGSNITWYASSDGNTNNIASGLSFGTLSVDTWYHIAVAKKGSSWAAWLNGTRGSTLTSASTPYYNVSALTKIGAYVGGAEFEGYIDDVRIINGLAIYDPASASITVPAAELGIVRTNIVDRKYNSGIWSLSDSYDRRLENIWPTTNLDLKYLIIGGGGSGGANLGGGGGGGEFVEGSLSVSGSYDIVVGAGGAAVTGNGTAGNDGGTSTFNGISAIGGGGGHGNGGNGRDGGSGGGGAGNETTTGGTGTAPTGQGNNGGTGTAAGTRAAGGGGGAGAVGANGSAATGGGAGGSGASWSINAIFYAGGGGGAANNGTGAGAGGNGGGGAASDDGATPINGFPGTDGLGGGGGGGPNVSGSVSGKGGDGVVIIAYLGSTIKASGGTITYDNGYTLHTFTSSGTFTIISGHERLN
jgi:hypothetical protein